MSTGFFRDKFWPIYGKENRKFIPMVLMLTLALFGYTSLRITKDTLIITAAASGAGVLNFLKGYIVMPVSILFVIFYSSMSNRFSKKNLFYVALAPFLIFFIAFSLILYPAVSYIHMSAETLTALQHQYPNFKYILPIFGNWSYSMFYVFAELWGTVSITLLFWQFANLSCTKEEVKRYYPLFGMYSNVGLIIAGAIQSYAISVEGTCFLVIASAVTITFLYWYLNSKVLVSDPMIEITSQAKSSKPKLSFSESIKLIMSSKYLAFLAIIILAYGMSANLVEVTWKAKLKELYPNKQELQIFLGKFFLLTGLCTMIIGLTVRSVIMRLGWLIASLITPIVLLVTSMSFFFFVVYSSWLLPATFVASGGALIVSVIIGAIQNIASKSSKYVLFDPTTQMTYIPLDDDLKFKGKAAVDVVGGRLGKSLGGHIQSAALLITGGSQLSIAPLLGGILLIVILLWILATFKLSKLYEEKLLQYNQKN